MPKIGVEAEVADGAFACPLPFWSSSFGSSVVSCQVRGAGGNACISCGRVHRPGGPARRVLCGRRDRSGRQLHAKLDLTCFIMALK